MFNRVLLYISFIRLEFIRMLAYRSTYLTGVFNYGIQIGAYYFLWDAIYGSKRSMVGLTKEQMLTYVIVAWIVRSFYFNNLDQNITKEVIDGSIALELIRPYSYQSAKLARSFGEAIFRLLFFSIPSALFIFLIRPYAVPSNLGTWLLFLVTLVGSYLINAQISLLVGYSAFYTHSTTGMLRTKRVMTDLLSGLLIPISFFPSWAQAMLKYLPFQAINYIPTMVFVQGSRGQQAWQGIGIQLAWIVFLFLTCHFVWKRVIRKIVIHGG